MLLTLKQFVEKYKDLNLTIGCMRMAIYRGHLLAIKTSNHCWQVDPKDVLSWLSNINHNNPAAIRKLNEIFYSEKFIGNE
ncbi:MAG: hypothetical protein A2Y10_19670 [Planctomycetes bacterium GWF2_41_51]|nr:MAG: hypothetical protein A2Y10_19670 [Planctomycetes bacterium GWF2_41_51]HBG28199.1 hypothetical protein [Phycisphaerales bacterium]